MTGWDAIERCMKAQGANRWMVPGDLPPVEHPSHGEVVVDVDYTIDDAPNLVLWTGAAHILALSLKDDVENLDVWWRP